MNESINEEGKSKYVYLARVKPTYPLPFLSPLRFHIPFPYGLLYEKEYAVYLYNTILPTGRVPVSVILFPSKPTEMF